MPNRKEGHLKCPKVDCNKIGSIQPHIRKDVVQIPNQKNIDTIVKAMDYNAKIFYRLYEFFTYLPFDNKFECRFNIAEYQRIVPFSPHTVEETIEFRDRFMKILSEKFDRFEKNNENNSKDLVYMRTEPNNDVDDRTLHKIKRRIKKETKKKNVNWPSITCLYCSISFASLRDVYKEMQTTSPFIDEMPLSAIKKKEFEIDKLFSKCLIIPYSSIKYLFDKRHNTPLDIIPKLLKDSVFGYYAASTMNSFDLEICKRCVESGGYVSVFENGKCPRCKNTKKKISKLHPKTIQEMESSISDNFNHMYFNYLNFLDFISRITDEIKNNYHVRIYYLSCFKKYEEQMINSECSYLRDNSYYMSQYDGSKSSKRKTCSLSNTDILNVIVEDAEYKKIITDGIEKNDTQYAVEKLLKILSEYNYPEEFAEQKAKKDIWTAIGSAKFAGNPHLNNIFKDLWLLIERN